MKKRAAIIGAGIGGLSASIYLALNNFEVFLFEKNIVPGGKASEIKSSGFRFDTGPTLITMPFILNDMFSAVGKNFNDHITLVKKENVCKYFFNDGTIFNEYADREKLLLEFESFTGENKSKLVSFINYSRRIYQLTANLFLFNSFLDFRRNLNFSGLKTLMRLHQIDPFRTVHKANQSRFKSKKIIQLFNRYATYNGSNPFKAPATLNIIPFVELEFGGYYCIGGIYRIVEELTKIATELGVKIYTNALVEKILVRNKRVIGVNVNGDEIKFDVVISNADLFYTYKNLLNDTISKEAKRYITQELSTSAIIFYFGIEGLHHQFEMDNILFSENYEREFNQLFDKKIIPDDPTIHIHISSKQNKGDAPRGCENWYVMINAPSVSTQKFEIEREKELVLNKIYNMTGVDLRNKIKFEAYQTPEILESRTSSLFGSLYGPSSNSRYSAFLRQKNKSSVYEGLYFCGGTVHPGGGIPLVISSGKITADLIKRFEK